MKNFLFYKTNLRLTILMVSLLVFHQKTNGQNSIRKDDFFAKAQVLKFQNPDSALFYYNKGYQSSLIRKDTSRAIKNLIALSKLHGHNLNYGKSYDGYWTALLLAEKSQDHFSKSNIYIGLGMLYSYYKRSTKALEYYEKSLEIRRSLFHKNLLHKDFLTENYFTIASYYRGNRDYKKVKTYLDSIKFIKDSDPLLKKSYYLEAEYGFLAFVNGQHDIAIEKLKSAQVFFEKNSPSYLVMIHSFLGKVYYNKGDINKAEEHFKKSLNYAKKFKSHLANRIEVYKQLYKVSIKKNNHIEAIKYLEKEKELNYKIFDIKSPKNDHLFEIKDKYRLEKEKQSRLLNEEKIKNLESEDRIWFLQSVLLVVVIVSLILFGLFFIHNIRTKHKNEKALLKHKQDLELKRQENIIELKNRELTESALRIIEKDEFISNIKIKLKKQKDNIDVNVINRLLRSIQGNPKSNWAEFEARFTSINQSFYNNLKNRFPQLRQTDLKICALVKLNFTSKEMSKLIGISVDSVNTSRSRLRKKLGLSRDQNLEEFINNL